MDFKDIFESYNKSISKLIVAGVQLQHLFTITVMVQQTKFLLIFYKFGWKWQFKILWWPLKPLKTKNKDRTKIQKLDLKD